MIIPVRSEPQRAWFSSAPLGPEDQGERRGSPRPSGLPYPLPARACGPGPGVRGSACDKARSINKPEHPTTLLSCVRWPERSCIFEAGRHGCFVGLRLASTADALRRAGRPSAERRSCLQGQTRPVNSAKRCMGQGQSPCREAVRGAGALPLLSPW